jgi:hypothetical protein
MTDLTGKDKALIDSVRGKLTNSTAGTPSGRPLDQRRRGYQLSQAEARAQGLPEQTYEDWIKEQAP